ncbi:elongation factor P hydroxylase [Aliiglaciecola sp. SL4]|uniref:elongation factor P hydroxylase n=1 Tax=Aliiglaciecola sp. SL4 TaxID=3239806 RepID=UPI00355AD119
MHHYRDLIDIFNQCFQISENTRLIKGESEPIYLPEDHTTSYHQVVFANGFFASGLHEIAHWCIAGKQRRLLEDYGYWYCPDGRNQEQQLAFEQVEVKPQAIEWAFSMAANFPFQVSTDNLNGVQPDRAAFQHKVRLQLEHYQQNGFPPRALIMIKALCSFYQVSLTSIILCDDTLNCSTPRVRLRA